MMQGRLIDFSHRYIARDTEELLALKAQRRLGRPSSSQEDQLRHRMEAEEKEFKSGFWIPDMREEKDTRKLRAWNGDWSSLNTLKFVRIGKEGGMKASTFPPKGLS
jgi:translation machinery-associated protein 16